MVEKLLPGPRFKADIYPRDIRRIASDVDNTLVPNEYLGNPSMRVTEAFRKASEDILVGIATARQPQKALNIINVLRAEGNHILSNGGQIYNGKEQVMVIERTIPVNLTMDIVRTLQSNKIEHWIQDDGVDHVWIPTNQVAKADRLISTGIGSYKRAVDVTDKNKGEQLITNYIPKKPFVIVAHRVTPKDAEQIGILISGYENQGLTSFVAHKNMESDGSESFEVFIADKKTNKSYALQEVSEIEKIPIKDFMGIGDGPNDKVLVETAGTGVAMGNGVEETKAVAVYIAPRREDDGAAVALETLVLKK